ncbi:MAG: hypothetical protein EHM20_13935 [Alphaproteobacteria bacterium]|nr:MAG: hypothetical protein EHM20_13935 [Alphaproteobacteria bacterium]
MKNLSLLLVMMITQSCMGGSDYYRDRVAPFLKDLKPHYKPQMVDGVMEPTEFPDLEEDQKTLVGIDSNHDGVRDDMEIFINRNFLYDYEREVFKGEYKRAAYFFSNYKKMNCEELIIQISNHSEETSCLNYVSRQLKLPDSPESRNFRSAESLYNTSQRETILTFISQKCAGMAHGDGYGDKTIFPNCIKKIEEKYLLKK